MKRPTVLVVAQAPGLVDMLLPVLDPTATDVIVVDSFTAGKRQLILQPQLLITELRLGEYNGLHLALRAQAHGVPTIVIGEADPVLERDAAALGASYVTSDEPIVERVETLLRRALRAQDRSLGAQIVWGEYKRAAQPTSASSGWNAFIGTPVNTPFH